MLRAIDEIRALGGRSAASRCWTSWQRLGVRIGAEAEPGRVAVLDLRRARTRRFQVAFVLGLEEGSLPGGGSERRVLDAAAAAELGVEQRRPGRARAAPLHDRVHAAVAHALPGPPGRHRRRPPARAVPVLVEVVRVLGPQSPGLVRRRGLADVSWPLRAAPSDRERLRALARELRDDADWATGVGAMMGWERKLRRAAVATRHETRVRDPELLAELAATERFSVTELERYGDCSSMWFVDRVLSPREIDFELDARMRGSIAHATLARFFTLLPAELGLERLAEDDLPAAYPLMRRCLHEALGGQRVPDSVAGKELARALERDLDAFLRAEADLALPLVPRRFEVRFGGPMAAPGLKDGLRIGDFAVSGQIDRIDMDPGMSAARARVGLQVGRERALGGRDGARGQAADPALHPRPARPARRRAARRHVPGAGGQAGGAGLVLAGEIETDGLARGDQLDADAFWAQVTRATEVAQAAVAGMRAGRRPARPAHGRVPGLVHAAHDLPGAAAVSRRPLEPEQRGGDRAPRPGVRRRPAPARARRRCWSSGCCAQVLGGTPIDRLLAITFTDRAASELRRRVREGARARGRDGAGAGDRHGLDLDHPPLLPAHPARERVRRRPRPALRRGRRGGRAPAALRGVRHRARAVPAGAPPDDGGRRLDLLAAYGRRRLRETLSDVHEQLRSAGRPLELRPHAVADLAPALAAAAAGGRRPRPRAGGAARGPARDGARPGGAGRPARRTRSATRPARQRLQRRPRGARGGGPATRRRSPTSASWRSSCGLLDAAYAERKDGRSLVDFTDLELRTRDLLTARPDLADGLPRAVRRA